MKRRFDPGLAALAILLLLCVVGGVLYLRLTAVYPVMGKPVSYPVNELPGFELSIEDPSWSPFKGYSIRYDIDINSEEVYYLRSGGSEEDGTWLERQVDGQWHRLNAQKDPDSNEWSDLSAWNIELGGGTDGQMSAGLVQKYTGYGTRLEPGLYRLIIELRDAQETPYYLAAEFTLE